MSGPARSRATRDARRAWQVTARQARRPLAGLLLALSCLALWLPGFTALPPVDRDESRFLLAARGMVASGDWLVPRLGGRPRLEKPPLATWLQAGSVALLTGGDPARDAPWMGRLPSLLAALATVLVLWRGGSRLVDPRAAWLAALLLAASPLVVWETRQARADLVLLLPTTLCLLALGSVWRAARRGAPPRVSTVLGFWLALLAAALAKGPVAPWIVVATVLGLALGAPSGMRWRWLGRLRPALGLAGVGAVLALLFGVQAAAVGARTLAAIGWRETAGRALAGLDGHFAPPGLHALLAPALLWPGSLGLLGGLAWSWRRARPRRPGRLPSPGHRFLLAWALPAWLGFELAATKLPHYTLPLHLPLLLLAARWLLRLAARTPAAWPAALRGPLAAWQVLPLPLVPTAAGALAWLATGSPALAGTLGLAVLALLVAAAVRVRSRPLAALGWALAGWALAVLAADLCLPRWPAPWTAQRLAAAVAATDPEGARPLADAGWGEASLPLLTRRPVTRLAPAEVAHWLGSTRDGLVVVPAGQEIAGASTLARVEGIDLAHGRRTALVLLGGPAPHSGRRW